MRVSVRVRPKEASPLICSLIAVFALTLILSKAEFRYEASQFRRYVVGRTETCLRYHHQRLLLCEIKRLGFLYEVPQLEISQQGERCLAAPWTHRKAATRPSRLRFSR